MKARLDARWIQIELQTVKLTEVPANRKVQINCPIISLKEILSPYHFDRIVRLIVLRLLPNHLRQSDNCQIALRQLMLAERLHCGAAR